MKDIPDGAYEIQLRAQCKPSAMTYPPEGLDESLSSTVAGHVDRQAPSQFGLFSEPADNEYQAGDSISVTFDEPIHCARPYAFRVRMTLKLDDGAELEYDERNLLVWCEGRTVLLEFSPSMSYDQVFGAKEVRMAISGVPDLVGNVMTGAIFWTFSVRRCEDWYSPILCCLMQRWEHALPSFVHVALITIFSDEAAGSSGRGSHTEWC